MDAILNPLRNLSRRWTAAAFILGCQLVGALGAATTATGSSAWYQSLSKPVFQPPAWVFGPVWILLYALMGLAAFRIWERRDRVDGSGQALLLFVVQLALNAMWTPVFFGAQEIGLALVILVSLWVTMLATLRAFRRIDRTAAMLLVPYLLWLSFAVALNAAILQMN